MGGLGFNLSFFLKCFPDLFKMSYGGFPRVVAANMLYSDIVVWEFVLKSRYCVPFWTNILRKGMNPFIPQGIGRIVPLFSFTMITLILDNSHVIKQTNWKQNQNVTYLQYRTTSVTKFGNYTMYPLSLQIKDEITFWKMHFNLII